MKYTVTATQVGEFLWQIDVLITDELDQEIKTGQINVAVEIEEQALAYGENIFLPDLRVCYPRELGGLVLTGEAQPEVVPEGGEVE